jgi:hypothetical protein
MYSSLYPPADGIMISIWALASIIGIPVFTSFTSKYSLPQIIGGKTIMVPQPEAYIYNCYWLCAMPLIAFVTLLFLNVHPHDRMLRQKKQDLRIRVFGHLQVITCRFLSKEQQAQEWEQDGNHKPDILAPTTPCIANWNADEDTTGKTANPVADLEAAKPVSSASVEVEMAAEK